MGPGCQPVVAAVQLGSPGWQPIAISVAIAAIFVLAWRAVLQRDRGRLASLPKLIALALLAACLVEPLWTQQRARPHENLLLVVVDNSRSLTISDDSGGPRSEPVRELVGNEEADWQVTLTREFDVRRFVVGEGLRSVTGFSNLEFDADSSMIESSLAALNERYSDHPVAGIILLSDGVSTDIGAAESTEGVSSAAAITPGGPPIYPVVPSSWVDVAENDISIRRVSVSETPFEDAPVKVNVDLTALQGETDIAVRLVDEEGEVVAEHTARTSPAGTASVEFEFRPDPVGLSSERAAINMGFEDVAPTAMRAGGARFYTLQAMSAGDWGDFDAGAGEAAWDNNSRLICLNRPLEPFRVLYVAGRPNWEFKFLRRAVQEDQQVAMVGLLRIARREGRFDFRGGGGGDTNPLFEGFGADEAAGDEVYDQPVIVRLGTEDETELQQGFPTTKEELFEYEAIILDDIEAEFFTQDQLELLTEFVSERGGGLLMLGGPETLRQGGWDDTALAAGLPVWLSSSQGGAVSAGAGTEGGPLSPLSMGSWKWELTREGWLEPAVRLLETQEEEETRHNQLPGLATISTVGRAKPAARVLAEVVNSLGERLPALIVQPYGNGRVGVITIGDFWRWSLSRSATVPDELPTLWRQMVRWLVADVPRRLEARIDPKATQHGTALEVVVDARSEDFEPQPEATVEVKVQTPDGETLNIPAEPSLEEPGRFELTYVPRDSGSYRIHAVGTGSDGEVFGEAEVGWTHNPLADEFESLTVRREWLESLANRSGGEVIESNSLEAFADSLPTRTAPKMETWSTPLWHRGPVLAAIITLLLVEWLLRRRQGLA
jgi:hypothetical protein